MATPHSYASTLARIAHALSSYTESHVDERAIKIFPDPWMADVWAVRFDTDYGNPPSRPDWDTRHLEGEDGPRYVHFLIRGELTEEDIEEVEFESWPPVSVN